MAVEDTAKAAKNEAPAIRVDGLRVRFGARTALRLDDWRVASGEGGLVIGPSGSGKTTLLNALAGLMTPNEGVVALFGEAWSSLSESARDRTRARDIGLVFQNPRLVPALSVRENVALAARYAGRRDAKKEADALLARLDIAELADRRPHQISLGEAQRVAIARAAAKRPALLLADEPTSALDDARAEATADLLAQEAAAAGATLLVVTHDARLKARFPTLLDLGSGGGRAP